MCTKQGRRDNEETDDADELETEITVNARKQGFDDVDRNRNDAINKPGPRKTKTTKQVAVKKTFTKKSKSKAKIKISLPKVSDMDETSTSRPDTHVSFIGKGQNDASCEESDAYHKGNKGDNKDNFTPVSSEEKNESNFTEASDKSKSKNQAFSNENGCDRIQQKSVDDENNKVVSDRSKLDRGDNKTDNEGSDEQGKESVEESEGNLRSSDAETKTTNSKFTIKPKPKAVVAKKEAKSAKQTTRNKDGKKQNNKKNLEVSGKVEQIVTPVEKKTSNVNSCQSEDHTEREFEEAENKTTKQKRPKTADVGTQCGSSRQSNGEDGDFYSPDEDCIRFHEALYGKKIDKDTVNDLLATRTIDERLAMVDAYKMRYKKDILQDTRSSFKGDYRDLCLALLQDQATQDAELLNYSVKGFGTNELALIHILAARSPQELSKIRKRYSDLFGHAVDVDIQGDTSGSFQTLCLVQLNREEDAVSQTNESIAEKDARRIWRPGERPTQDHEDVLIEILTSLNKEQFASVCHIYHKITDITFKDAVMKSTKGDFRDALLAMATCLEDRASYCAETLHKSLKGFRSNDRVVINIMISEMETSLSEIDEVFKEKYHKSLYQAIKSNYSGDFARLSLKIVENYICVIV